MPSPHWAMSNMCAHRGAQIMPEGNGNTHRFTCPYHAWTFELDGGLKACAEMGAYEVIYATFQASE